MLPRHAGNIRYIWIPACAGMTSVRHYIPHKICTDQITYSNSATITTV